jgi:hypothetical protein
VKDAARTSEVFNNGEIFKAELLEEHRNNVPTEYYFVDNNGKKLCDVKGWYMSEKLDGIKGRWIKGKFVSRSGKVLEAPDSFLKLLGVCEPEFDVEGELYFGKNTFFISG